MFARLAVGMALIASTVALTAFQPQTTVTGAQTPGDSTRVIVRWTPICDLRGCADSVRVVWSGPGVPTTGPVPELTRIKRAGNTDTIFVKSPVVGDSATITAKVYGFRDNRAGGERAGTLALRTPFVPLPAPDTVRLDTLSIASIAAGINRDSFPDANVSIVACLPHGYELLEGYHIQEGDTVVLGLLGVNQHTGQVRAFMGDPVACEPARQELQSEVAARDTVATRAPARVARGTRTG